MSVRDRSLGQPLHIRVITNQVQFRKWWPEFVQSIGKYPVVGLNCRKNSKEVLRQMDLLQHKVDLSPPPVSQSQREEWDKQAKIEGGYDYDYEAPKDETHPRNNRDMNAKQGKVSLVQLASFGGNVILFRSCFFRGIPKPLASLLQKDVVKVTQGFEKDKKALLESFGVMPSCYLDIRQICARWPYLTAHYDFQRYGVRSIAKYLLGSSFDDWGNVSPYWVTTHLEEEQIRMAAQEVQLYVDVFTVTMMRYLGLTLPRNWLHNDTFGQVMFLWSASLFEKPFLDSKFRPIPVKDVSTTAAKRSANHKLLADLKEELSVKGNLRLATLWAWTLPRSKLELEKMIIRDPAATLPSAGYPFVAVNMEKLLGPEGVPKGRNGRVKKDWKKEVWMVGETMKEGKKIKYRMKVSVSVVDERGLEGWSGGGAPLDLDTAFGGSEDADEMLIEDKIEDALQKVKDAAESVVPFLATRREWKTMENKHSRQVSTDSQSQETGGKDLVPEEDDTSSLLTENVKSIETENMATPNSDVVVAPEPFHPMKAQGSSMTTPDGTFDGYEWPKDDPLRSRYDRFYNKPRCKLYPQYNFNGNREKRGIGLLTNGPYVLGTRHAGAIFKKPLKHMEMREEEQVYQFGSATPEGEGFVAWRENNCFRCEGDSIEYPQHKKSKSGDEAENDGGKTEDPMTELERPESADVLVLEASFASDDGAPMVEEEELTEDTQTDEQNVVVESHGLIERVEVTGFPSRPFGGFFQEKGQGSQGSPGFQYNSDRRYGTGNRGVWRGRGRGEYRYDRNRRGTSVMRGEYNRGSYGGNSGRGSFVDRGNHHQQMSEIPQYPQSRGAGRPYTRPLYHSRPMETRGRTYWNQPRNQEWKPIQEQERNNRYEMSEGNGYYGQKNEWREEKNLWQSERGERNSRGLQRGGRGWVPPTRSFNRGTIRGGGRWTYNTNYKNNRWNQQTQGGNNEWEMGSMGGGMKGGFDARAGSVFKQDGDQWGRNNYRYDKY